MIERTLTPLDSRLLSAALLANSICESIAVHSMVQSALAIEREYSRVGQGVPPLENANEVWTMWQRVTEFASVEV